MGPSRKEDFTQFPPEEAGQAWPLRQLLSHQVSPGGAHLCSEAVCGLKTFSNSGGTQAHAYHKVLHSASYLGQQLLSVLSAAEPKPAWAS